MFLTQSLLFVIDFQLARRRECPSSCAATDTICFMTKITKLCGLQSFRGLRGWEYLFNKGHMRTLVPIMYCTGIISPTK